MANTYLSDQKHALAKNLIETIGLQRALHAAKQYGWHDIATEISEKIDRDSRGTHGH
ncbi:MAG: hypothetical protein JKX94_05760 [Sneathiella sp.]|nr:hypothetical protein [Sneathiella sp.]